MRRSLHHRLMTLKLLAGIFLIPTPARIEFRFGSAQWYHVRATSHSAVLKLLMRVINEDPMMLTEKRAIHGR